MKVLVVEPSGAMVAAHDLAKLTENEDERADLGLGGFGVDRDGSLLFTIPTQFAAFIVTPSGEVKRFGQKGSAPGKFQVVAGIGRDAAGNVFVSDVLKSAVIMFDRALNFVDGVRLPRAQAVEPGRARRDDRRRQPHLRRPAGAARRERVRGEDRS